jgi:hypothetical protein
VLVARIVVDVDGDGAQLRDFVREGGEGIVVLSVGGRVRDARGSVGLLGEGRDCSTLGGFSGVAHLSRS